MFFPKHRKAKILINPEELEGPGEGWACRKVDRDHIGVLEKSFNDAKTVNKKISVVLVDDDLFEEFSEAKAKIISEHEQQMNKGYKGAMLCEEYFSWEAAKRHISPQTHSGNHSRLAICRLKEAYPGENLYAQIEIEDVYICGDNQEARSILRCLGNAGNFSNTIHKVMTFPEEVQMVREHLIQIKLECGHPNKEMARKALKKAVAEYKMERIHSTGMSSGHVVMHVALGLLDEPLWVPVLKIITGDYTPKNAKMGGAMKGYSIFNDWASLGRSHQQRFLLAIVNGESCLSNLANECKMLKAKFRGMTEAVEFLRTNGSLEDQLFDKVTKSGDLPWSKVEEVYPGVLKKVIEPYISTICKTKIKSPIDISFFNALMKFVKNSKAVSNLF
jgi:hypothetical protein